MDNRIDNRFLDRPHGDNVHVNPLYQYQARLTALTDLASAEAAERQALLADIDQCLGCLHEPARIVIAGGFNAGKSTFINALLKRRLMPVKPTRMTATLNCLMVGVEPTFTLHRLDGRQETRDYANDADLYEKLRDLMARERDQIERIDIRINDPAVQDLLKRFTLIDTPGLDYGEQDTRISLDRVREADALIWLLHNSGLRKQDDQPLREFHASHPDRPLIVIINQIDSLDEPERVTVQREVERQLGDIVTRVFLLSARQAFNGRTLPDVAQLEASRFGVLNDYLNITLFHDYHAIRQRRVGEITRELLPRLRDFIQRIDWPSLHPDLMAQYRTAVETVWLNRSLDLEEITHLEEKAEQLGMPRKQIDAIEREVLGAENKADLEAVKESFDQAKRGDAEGQFRLGRMYEQGRGGLLKDEKRAAEWYRKAAEQGNARGQIALGRLYEAGLGVARDAKAALAWYRKAAEQGDAEGQFNLGRAYETALGMWFGNPKEALLWYGKAAHQGHVAAQAKLGDLYATGRGTTEDTPTAAEWYLKAARQGHEASRIWILRHEITKHDMNWLKAAMDQTELEQLLKLRVQTELEQLKLRVQCHYRPTMPGNNAWEAGLTGKHIEARWYELAAGIGDAVGQNNLARLYETGRGGLPKNLEEATKWYKKSADQRDITGLINLARMLENGYGGLTAEFTVSLRLYLAAAEAGNRRAQMSLALALLTGRGVEKDLKLGDAWFGRVFDDETTAAARLDRDIVDRTRTAVGTDWGNQLLPEMVRLPGGTFWMGSPSDEADRYDDERRHEVTVQPFAIGKYPVTQGEWQAVMWNNPSSNSGCDRCPVETVSWHDAQAYIAKLNALTGQRFRLPTEAEWEYAARAGQDTRYAGGEDIDAVAWCASSPWSGFTKEISFLISQKADISSTHPVGQKQPNAFGLYDMSGNVWEWTASAYSKDYDGSELVSTNDDNARRAIRGGSWGHPPALARVASRFGLDPAIRIFRQGFRLAQD